MSLLIEDWQWMLRLLFSSVRKVMSVSMFTSILDCSLRLFSKCHCQFFLSKKRGKSINEEIFTRPSEAFIEWVQWGQKEFFPALKNNFWISSIRLCTDFTIEWHPVLFNQKITAAINCFGINSTWLNSIYCRFNQSASKEIRTQYCGRGKLMSTHHNNVNFPARDMERILN